MSKFYKCDVCGKEISYGVGDKARGLMWGGYSPAGPGTNAYVSYKKNSEDILLEDVCPECMDKVMKHIETLKSGSVFQDLEKIETACEKASEYAEEQLEEFGKVSYNDVYNKFMEGLQNE